MSALATLALVVVTSTAPRPLTPYEADLYREIVLLDGEVRERDLRIRTLTEQRDEARALADRAQQRLVEAPPLAPETLSPVLVGVVAGGIGLALGVLLGAFAL